MSDDENTGAEVRYQRESRARARQEQDENSESSENDKGYGGRKGKRKGKRGKGYVRDRDNDDEERYRYRKGKGSGKLSRRGEVVVVRRRPDDDGLPDDGRRLDDDRRLDDGTKKHEDREEDCTLVRRQILVGEASGRVPVHTLTFKVPGERPLTDVVMGKGQVLLVECPGKKKATAYSATALNPHAREFDITVKVYPDGVCSKYLGRIPVGEKALVVLKELQNEIKAGRFVAMVAFGVGITDCWTAAVSELSRDPSTRVTLLWAVRTMRDTFWSDRIDDLKAIHRGRFRVVHIVSREPNPSAPPQVRPDARTAFHGYQGKVSNSSNEPAESTARPSAEEDAGEGVPDILRGRVSKEVVEHVFLKPWRITSKDSPNAKDLRWLTCGTQEMMWHVDEIWQELGYSFQNHSLFSYRERTH